MIDKIERARNHLAMCMEREDWPSHNCACNCSDVSELLTENEALHTALTGLVDALHDATADGPVLVGQAEEFAILILAGEK